MRLLKLAIISFFGLFLVIFLLSLLIPSKMRVSRAITIEAEKDKVTKYLYDLREWEKWNVLLNNPQQQSVVYSENKYSSNQMQVELLSIDSSQVLTSWKRVGQKPVIGGFGITGSGSVTVVQGFFDFEVKWYPWEKFGSIVFDKEIGPLLEKSLDQLNKLCTSTP